MLAFANCRSGNFAVMFAILVPLLLGLTGGLIDFIAFQRHRSSMQDVADQAALAAAKEATIKNWSQSAAQAVTDTYVEANLRQINASSASYTAVASLDKAGKTIQVALEMDHYGYFVLGYFRGSPQIRVEASASVAGDTPICVIGLDGSAPQALSVTGSAAMLADQCAVYANSSDPDGVHVDSKARITSGFTCAAGGYDGSLSSFDPAPTTDCPALSDPLADRPAPAFGSCDHSEFSVKNGTFSIEPGVYCDGLLIDNNAVVDMKPGIYVIKGGEFRIRNNGSLKGDGVGIYFTGDDGRAVFDGTSDISLTAPVNGEMAGLLMFQDRGMDLTEFEISSKSASVLLGTIYLPNGILEIKANNPVAESSAFTVIVSRILNIGNKAKLYINSGYSSTNVPVPDGLGPAARARLTN